MNLTIRAPIFSYLFKGTDTQPPYNAPSTFYVTPRQSTVDWFDRNGIPLPDFKIDDCGLAIMEFKHHNDLALFHLIWDEQPFDYP